MHAAEFLQQRRLARVADAGEFVEDALGDLLEAQLRVVAVGHAMRFVADALEQLEGVAAVAQAQRLGLPRPVNLLELLRQSDDGNGAEAELREFRARRVELALAAVDHNQGRKVRGKDVHARS